VRIRLLVFEGKGPAIRATWDPREPGPFTLGFPTTNLPELDARLRRLGFESLAPMEQSQIPRPDGTKYGLQESVFKGPDRVHAVGVSRLDGMPQLGPVDPETANGGPAYSAQVVVNSDAVVRFYCELLGLELRSDREWKSGPTSAIGLPAGTPFRLALIYSPGASTGQLLLMDFRDAAAPPSGIAPRPPGRGLGICSFAVRSLDATAAKLRSAGVTVVGGPISYDSPDLGPHRAMTVLAPNGVIVELFERAAAVR
jgi:catechol 2,3-dioxygenase-like lactoylglutathione lyase family enzyme